MNSFSAFFRKHLLESALIIIIITNLLLSSWFVVHRELNLHADVARDFLLFEELQQKKIVLIGARSGTQGLFHGPVWTYLNFPAYYLGHGDAAVVGEFWYLLNILFLSSAFFVGQKIGGRKTALIYTALLSGNMIYHVGNLSTYHGALFIAPLFFLTLYSYLHRNRWWLLLLHFFLAGLVIEFQMAVGIPFFIISVLVVSYSVVRSKHYSHLLAILIVPLVLSNFIIFDLRHNFEMVRSALVYASPNTNAGTYNYLSLINERFNHAVDFQLTPALSAQLMGIIFTVTMFLSWAKWRSTKDGDRASLLLAVFFFGYLLLSFINKGIIQYQQFLPLMAITNLWFALVVSASKNKIAWLLLAVVFLLNLIYAGNYVSDLQNKFLGKAPDSWQFLRYLGREITATENGQKFGFFIYSPDAFAYTQRYAIRQVFREKKAQGFEYTKLPVTYVIAAPPDLTRVDLSYNWWRENQANIKATPSAVVKFPNGYLIERFELTPDEQKEPFNKLIELDLHFR